MIDSKPIAAIRAPAVTGQAIVEYARTFLGTPFQPRGRDERGLDCVGLCIVVAKHFGLTVDINGYRDRLDFEYANQMLRLKGFRAVDPSNVQIGDLIIFHHFLVASAVAIISELGRSPFFNISRTINVESDAPGFLSTAGRSSRMCVVEESTALNMSDQIRLATQGITIETLKRTMAFYRFPFVH